MALAQPIPFHRNAIPDLLSFGLSLKSTPSAADDISELVIVDGASLIFGA